MLKSANRLYIEIIISLIIVLLPFALYLHLLFEDYSQSLELFGFTYHHGLPGNEVFIWMLLKKIIAISLLIIWFLTCSYRWRYFIFSPILLYSYSLIQSLTFDFGTKPSFSQQFLVIAPYLILFSFILVLISQKLNRLNINKAYDLAIKDVRSFRKYSQLRRSVTKFLKYKTKTKIINVRIEYLKKLFYVREKIKDKLIIPKNFLKTKSYLAFTLEVTIGLILLLIPFLYFSFELIPDRYTVVKILGITFDSNGFVDLPTFVWYFMNVLCLTIPLCIWFLTERNWWRFAIFSPIILSAYQIWEVLYMNSKAVDESEYMKSIPFILVILLTLLILSYITRFKYQIVDIYEEISQEIEELLKWSDLTGNKLQDKKTKLSMLKHRFRCDNSINDHLESLLKLKEELIIEINRAGDG